MVNILYSNLKSLLTPDVFKRHLEKLPIPLQVKVKGKKYPIDVQNSLIGKILLIRGLKRYYKPIPEFAPGDARIEIFYDRMLSDLSYTPYNRPYLRGHNIDFNIAHSGSLVVCALQDEGQIGVDVERITAINFSEFKNQFSTEEICRIENAKDKERKFCFYWTVKEAVSKAQGVGFSMPLVNVSISEDEVYAQVFSKKWFIHELSLDTNYCSCLVTEKFINESDILMNSLSKNYWKDPLLNTNMN